MRDCSGTRGQRCDVVVMVHYSLIERASGQSSAKTRFLCRFLGFAKLVSHRRYNLAHVSTPTFERILTLAKEFVALIHRSNTRDRTGLVIENPVGDVRSDS